MAALYSEVLLDHFRNPRNYGSLPSPDTAYEEFNPLCGDRLRIELKISDNRIAAARFVGDGCAICIEVCPWSEPGRGVPISERVLAVRRERQAAARQA